MIGLNYFIISSVFIVLIELCHSQISYDEHKIYFPDSEVLKVTPAPRSEPLLHQRQQQRQQIDFADSQPFNQFSTPRSRPSLHRQRQPIDYAVSEPFNPVSTPRSTPFLHYQQQSNDFADSVTSFTWQLFQGSKLPNSLGNLVLSPILIQLLLGILEYAAEGETKNQLRQIIGFSDVQQIRNVLQSSSAPLSTSSTSSSSFSSLSTPEVTKQQSQLSSATGIFLDSSNRLNQSFANVVKSIGSDVIPLNFKRSDLAKDIINDWVGKQTQGYITELLSPSYQIENTEIILTSAIYFHNIWKFKFNNIGLRMFESLPGIRGNQVEFMETKQYFLFRTIDLGNNYIVNVVELPYKGDEYSMVIILPDDNVPLDTLIRRINATTFDSILKILSASIPKLITLRMPKFSIKSQFSVVNSLLKMGLVDIFTINSRLPYIGLIDEQKISDILQRAVLTVDEDGTVATAAAAAILVPLSAIRDDIILNVNKPFLSVILDKRSRIPLFISKIYTP